MTGDKNHLLEKSLRLLDEYLDSVTDEEFIKEYKKHEMNNGPLIVDYILELKETYESLGFKDTTWLINKHISKT